MVECDLQGRASRKRKRMALPDLVEVIREMEREREALARDREASLEQRREGERREAELTGTKGTGGVKEKRREKGERGEILLVLQKCT